VRDALATRSDPGSASEAPAAAAAVVAELAGAPRIVRDAVEELRGGGSLVGESSRRGGSTNDPSGGGGEGLSALGLVGSLVTVAERGARANAKQSFSFGEETRRFEGTPDDDASARDSRSLGCFSNAPASAMRAVARLAGADPTLARALARSARVADAAASAAASILPVASENSASNAASSDAAADAWFAAHAFSALAAMGSAVVESEEYCFATIF
jgi:hypothetical protein